MKTLLAVAATALLLVSCHHQPTCGEKNPPALAGEFLFEIEHTNFAWGARHEGVAIDRNGRLFRYSNAAWLTDRTRPTTTFTAAELNEKYGSALTYVKTLKSSEVLGYYAEATAATGSSGERVSYCNDAGSTACIAYAYDAKTQRYTRRELMLRGDSHRTHSDARATRAAEWLRTLDKPYTDFPCAGE